MAANLENKGVLEEKPLQELQLHEIGYPPDHGYGIAEHFPSINSLYIGYERAGQTFFSYIIDCSCRNARAELVEPYWDYVHTIIASRLRKDKKGFDVNLLNRDGTSHIKILIKAFSQEHPEKFARLEKLLQKLIDVGASLTSEKYRAAEHRGTFIPWLAIDTPNLFQTPLDYAFQVCPRDLRLDLDHSWSGYPESPPPIFAPIRILLKAIYLKTERDASVSLLAQREGFRQTKAFQKFKSKLDERVFDHIFGFLPKPVEFEFTQKLDDIQKLLRFGKLFAEYDEAVERQKRGQVAAKLDAQQNTQAMLPRVLGDVKDRVEPTKTQVQAQPQTQVQSQRFQQETTAKLKVLEQQLAQVSAEQASFRKEFQQFTQEFTMMFKSLMPAQNTAQAGSKSLSLA